MPTNHLGVEYIEVGQAQKEVTANEAFAAFDLAIENLESVQSLAGTGTVDQDASLVVVGGSGARTVTLPAGSSSRTGKAIWIKDGGTAGPSAVITISRSGSDLIDGASSISIAAAYGLRCVRWTGSFWAVII